MNSLIPLDPYERRLSVGDRVPVYDSRVWARRGRDLGGNSDCWRFATIVAIYREPRSPLYPEASLQMMFDVMFDGDLEVSKGHFQHAIECYVSSDLCMSR